MAVVAPSIYLGTTIYVPCKETTASTWRKMKQIYIRLPLLTARRLIRVCLRKPLNAHLASILPSHQHQNISISQLQTQANAPRITAQPISTKRRFTVVPCSRCSRASAAPSRLHPGNQCSFRADRSTNYGNGPGQEQRMRTSAGPVQTDGPVRLLLSPARKTFRRMFETFSISPS